MLGTNLKPFGVWVNKINNYEKRYRKKKKTIIG